MPIRDLSRPFAFLLIAAAFLATAPGCTPASKLRPVSGTVTYKGEPLDTGSIAFLYTDPPGPAGGALIANGKFQIASPAGLEPGIYKVAISSPKGPGQRTPEQIAAGASVPAKERIPPDYNTVTKITVEVTQSGPNEFHWSIE